ncbi:hypothetical protein ABZ249_00195 [Nocardiopsis sp. NPDC006139]|uniref:hypothetical protein n=1 Tax=Nocardiopsis sp. NPDC006139 TaxID=3154578 RepID=UPI0033B109E8
MAPALPFRQAVEAQQHQRLLAILREGSQIGGDPLHACVGRPLPVHLAVAGTFHAVYPGGRGDEVDVADLGTAASIAVSPGDPDGRGYFDHPTLGV